jgi:hypothetical protein
MTDIVERLRSKSPYLTGSSAERTMTEAAEEIERLGALAAIVRVQGLENLDLRAEIERLRTALEEIEHTTRHKIRRWDIANEIARRALEPKP